MNLLVTHFPSKVHSFSRRVTDEANYSNKNFQPYQHIRIRRISLKLPQHRQFSPRSAQKRQNVGRRDFNWWITKKKKKGKNRFKEPDSHLLLLRSRVEGASVQEGTKSEGTNNGEIAASFPNHLLTRTKDESARGNRRSGDSHETQEKEKGKHKSGHDKKRRKGRVTDGALLTLGIRERRGAEEMGEPNLRGGKEAAAHRRNESATLRFAVVGERIVETRKNKRRGTRQS